ncbi:MAG: phosphotransferase family protein, partial [Myxococcota bacterium]
DLLSGFTDLGKPEGYVARQVSGWVLRYEKAQTDQISDMDRVAHWLQENQPPSQSGAFIHNDYKLDNLLLAPDDLTRIVSVLDWEMATVGCPLMDLGTTLGYWVEASDPDTMKTPPFPPTFLPGGMSRQEVVERYSEKTDTDVASPVFYYAFGLFKIAVIAQQIYKRFKEGHSKDPRFAGMIFAVTLLSQTAAKAIDRDRIHDLA